MTLLDMGFRASSQKKNPGNKWFYMFEVCLESHQGVIVWINDTEALLWNEGQFNKRNRRCKDNSGWEFDNHQDMISTVISYANQHPDTFSDVWDERLRELERDQTKLHWEVKHLKECYPTDMYEWTQLNRPISELQEQIETFTLNPKLKSIIKP